MKKLIRTKIITLTFLLTTNAFCNNDITSEVQEKVRCDTPAGGFAEVLTRSRMINEMGGKIEVAGVTLNIPANTVSSPTLITFTQTSKNETEQTFIIHTNPKQKDENFANDVTLSRNDKITNKNLPEESISLISIKTNKLDTEISL